ncbi:hypothetical protein QJS10_CPB15g01176 [Acorus calamus]|uniref:Reverse transcriptase domain-containing protein n=1 Tax=Acorus calamus TaxID=4465 RepID=A0AAV9D9I1_ACOCL|nr:hypothetical protein QJS10_CPB15g01176 [Acorus calamus]
MEALSHMINSAIEEGRLGKFVKSKLNVSHLAFADDLMVFTDSSSESALALKTLFEDFSHWSGLHLNTSKSQLFYGGPINPIFIQIMEIQPSHTSSTYLGVPLKAGLPRASCRTLLDWILWLDKLPIRGIVKNIVKATLASAVGIIWRERCVRIFRSKSKPKSMLLKDIIRGGTRGGG